MDITIHHRRLSHTATICHTSTRKQKLRYSFEVFLQNYFSKCAKSILMIIALIYVQRSGSLWVKNPSWLLTKVFISPTHISMQYPLSPIHCPGNKSTRVGNTKLSTSSDEIVVMEGHFGGANGPQGICQQCGRKCLLKPLI